MCIVLLYCDVCVVVGKLVNYWVGSKVCFLFIKFRGKGRFFVVFVVFVIVIVVVVIVIVVVVIVSCNVIREEVVMDC